MPLTIRNTGEEHILIEHETTKAVLAPGETMSLESDLQAFPVKISYTVKDKFNSLWYMLTEIFALEPMRTVLVVNGEYDIQCTSDDPFLKIGSREFVFDKHMSYQTFVFSAEGCLVTRKNFAVADRQKIMKKAKILYLFGGSRTFLPLSALALAVFLIGPLLVSAVPDWNWTMIFVLACCFAVCFFRYCQALRQLKNAMEPANILSYMASPRKEYRNYMDEVAQKQREKKLGEDRYF